MATLFILFGTILLGYLLRNFNFPSVPPSVITGIVWVLLLLMGISIGSNPEIIYNLTTYGKEALIIGGLATLGSAAAAICISKMSHKR